MFAIAKPSLQLYMYIYICWFSVTHLTHSDPVQILLPMINVCIIHIGYVQQIYMQLFVRFATRTTQIANQGPFYNEWVKSFYNVHFAISMIRLRTNAHIKERCDIKDMLQIRMFLWIFDIQWLYLLKNLKDIRILHQEICLYEKNLCWNVRYSSFIIKRRVYMAVLI